MEALIEEILIKLNELPEPRLREVLRFVEQINQPAKHPQTIDWTEEPLLSIAGMLSGEPLSAQAIETELYDD